MFKPIQLLIGAAFVAPALIWVHGTFANVAEALEPLAQLGG